MRRLRAATGSPRQVTPPDAAVIRPATRLSSVDFPQPDGPMTATISPRSTLKLKWSRTILLPKTTRASRISTAGPAAGAWRGAVAMTASAVWPTLFGRQIELELLDRRRD